MFTNVVGKLQPILAALPRQLAEVALRGGDARPGERAALVSRLEADIDQRGADGFDLDQVADAELEEPERPLPPYDLDALDALLRRPRLLPAAVEVKALSPREYEITMPGMERLRVTTDRDQFEEHAGTYELWSPGSPLFPRTEDLGEPRSVPNVALREVMRGLR